MRLRVLLNTIMFPEIEGGTLNQQKKIGGTLNQQKKIGGTWEKKFENPCSRQSELAKNFEIIDPKPILY